MLNFTGQGENILAVSKGRLGVQTQVQFTSLVGMVVVRWDGCGWDPRLVWVVVVRWDGCG